MTRTITEIDLGDEDQRLITTSVLNGVRYMGLALPDSALVRTRMALDYLDEYPNQRKQWRKSGFQAVVHDTGYQTTVRHFHSVWIRKFQSAKMRCDSLGGLHRLTEEQAAIWHAVARAFLIVHRSSLQDSVARAFLGDNNNTIYDAGKAATEHVACVLSPEEIKDWIFDPQLQINLFLHEFQAPVRVEEQDEDDDYSGDATEPAQNLSFRVEQDITDDNKHFPPSLLLAESRVTMKDKPLIPTIPPYPGIEEDVVERSRPTDMLSPIPMIPAEHVELLPPTRTRTHQPQDEEREDDADNDEAESPELVTEMEETFDPLYAAFNIPNFSSISETKLDIRCPVCRKKLSSSDDSIQYNGLTMHKNCFSCRVCDNKFFNKEGQQVTLSPTSSIQQFIILGRVKFQCATCTAVHDKAQIFSKEAGKRIRPTQEEHGDTKRVREEIGDDLEQAVYFMTPRCFVCGGDFGTDPKKAKFKCEGRTLFHPVCYETGRPSYRYSSETPKPTVKLPPSFCAQYLPQQIILKLSPPRSRALTTLYFVWNNRESHAIQIRKEDSDVVSVPFELDEDAPANPNPRKGQSNSTWIPVLPNNYEELQLELVTGIEVAPRHPQMPEAATITTSTSTGRQQLSAQLEYLKFGLTYLLVLTIPVITTTTKTSSTEEQSQPPPLQLYLLGASLTVKIWDNDKPKIGNEFESGSLLVQ